VTREREEKAEGNPPKSAQRLIEYFQLHLASASNSFLSILLLFFFVYLLFK